MPTYEYQCTICGHQLEMFQKMTDEPLLLCPVCQQSGLTKLISATNFQLKGSGWYVTDFRDKGKKPVGEGADKGHSEGNGVENTDSKEKGSNKADNNTEKSDDITAKPATEKEATKSNGTADANSTSASKVKATESSTRTNDKSAGQ